MNISDTVQPIGLPPPTVDLDPPAGLMVTVAGWGTTSVRKFHLSYNFVLNANQTFFFYFTFFHVEWLCYYLNHS